MAARGRAGQATREKLGRCGRERERGVGLGREKNGPAGWVAVGLGLILGPVGFVFLPISILFPSKTKLFEFKQSLNSTALCTQANKIKTPA